MHINNLNHVEISNIHSSKIYWPIEALIIVDVFGDLSDLFFGVKSVEKFTFFFHGEN